MKISFKLFGVSLLIVAMAGCSKNNSDAVTVHCDNLQNDNRPATDEGRIDVANAITPNGDGLNDRFHPFFTDVQTATTRIYDANSNQVFETTSFVVDWPATNQSQNYINYYYRIEGITNDGNKIGVCGRIYSITCIPSTVSVNEISFSDQYTPFGFTGVTAETLEDCD